MLPNTNILIIPSTWLRNMFVDVSMLITVLISLERSLCVVRLITFKGFMTRQRTIAVIATIYAYCIICYSPIVAHRRLEWVTNPKTNTSRLRAIGHGKVYLMATLFVRIWHGIGLNTLSQIIVTLSTFTMIRGLRKSAQICTAATGSSDQKVSKHTALVKMVTFVSGVFVVCNTPLLCLTFAQLFEPELSDYGRFANTLYTVYSVCFVSSAINASVNIFI